MSAFFHGRHHNGRVCPGHPGNDSKGFRYQAVKRLCIFCDDFEQVRIRARNVVALQHVRKLKDSLCETSVMLRVLDPDAYESGYIFTELPAVYSRDVGRYDALLFQLPQSL